MHFYELPWPKEALEELGETSIKNAYYIVVFY